MRPATYAPFLFLLGVALHACSERHTVQPDQSAQGLLKQKVFVAPADPSRVLYQTEYEYTPDQKLLKTATYSSQQAQNVLQEYTEFAYDNQGQLSGSTQYNRSASGAFLPAARTIFDYQQGVLVRETIIHPVNSSYYTYEYAEDQLIKKSYFEGNNQLIQYTDFKYDSQGKLIGETTTDGVDRMQSFAQLSYRNGLMYSREEYTQNAVTGKADLWRRVLYTHDAERRLSFEKTDYIHLASSAIHPSVKYEYY